MEMARECIFAERDVIISPIRATVACSIFESTSFHTTAARNLKACNSAQNLPYHLDFP